MWKNTYLIYGGMRWKIKNCANLVYIVFKDAGSVINSIQGGITKKQENWEKFKKERVWKFWFSLIRNFFVGWLFLKRFQ